MKKLVLLLMVVVLPASAFMVEESVHEIWQEIADYEGLEGAERANFAQTFLEKFDGRWQANNKKSFHVMVDDLRAIKPFIKKSGNPVFQDWLFQAINSGDHDSVQYLISELGIDVNAVDAHGDSALHNAAMQHNLWQTKNIALFKITDFLLNNGANSELCGSSTYTDECTPLGYVAAQVVDSPVDWRDLVELLLRHGASIDSVNNRGQNFFQVMEEGYNRKRQKLSVRCISQNKLQKQLDNGRVAMNRVLEIPLIAERFAERAERQALEVAPFLPGKHGIVGHVLEYLEPVALVEYRKQKKEIRKEESECEENKSDDGE